MKRLATICLLISVLFSLFISGCTKSPDEKRAAYMKSAAEYVTKGKYAEAAIQYQNALQIAPDDAKALVALGEAQIKLMKVNEAYKSFTKAASVDPKNIKAHEYLASMQLLAKKDDMAIKEASLILKYEPQNKTAKELLAQAYFRTGKQAEAIELMEGLLKEQKPSEATIMNASQMYMATGRGDDAMSLLSRGASLYPTSAKIRLLASDICSFKGNVPLAQKWAEEAYQVNKNDINAGIALGRFYAGHKMDAPFSNLMSELKSKFPKDPSPYLLESGVMRQKKDLDKALALAEKAGSLQDSTLTKTVIAEILLEKGDIGRAQKNLKEAIEKDTKSIPARLLLAQIYIQGNNPKSALETLDILIKNIPRRPDVAVPAAQAYLLQGDVAKARELVGKSMEQYKDIPSLHATMAKIHFSEGKFQETLAEVEYLGARSLTSPELLYVGALSSIRLNQKEKAQALINALQKMKPDSWPALHAQCLFSISKGDKQGAYRFAERAVDLYPQKPQALALYSGIAPAVVTKEEAIRKVSGICAKNNSAFSHMILARLLETSGNLNGALAQMKEAVKLESDNTSLYHAMAQFYARHNMMKQAIDEYEALVNKNPNDIRAALMLALLNQGQGNTADAKKVYTYILSREPKNALAANNLSWILAEQGSTSDLNEALRLAQIAKDKYPEDPRIADTLGFIYIKKGLSENAVAQFQLALEKLPLEPAVNYHMAWALNTLKRQAEARKYIENALNSKTNFAERGEAQKLLAKINAESKK